MSENYVFDPDDEDVDLDTEDIRLKDGTRLTNELASRIADEAHQDIQRRRQGRPSLSGQEPSPIVGFRIPEQLRILVEERAKEEGRSISELAREALQRYLARHG